MDGPKIIHVARPELVNSRNPEESNIAASITVKAPNYTSEDVYPVMIMHACLGNSPNSRLIDVLSRQKGLAYSVKTNYSFNEHQGCLDTSGSFHNKRLEEAIDEIFTQFNVMQKEKIKEKELDDIKKRAVFLNKKKENDIHNHASNMDLFWEIGLTPEIFIQKLNKVTVDDVLEAANKYLPKSRNDPHLLFIENPLKKE